ncbi:hypothetical membrane protein [Listeria monocytogenes str. Scott A]|nr:hypothetical membrane protein [Listeria monocytogenes str. Scott A]
MTKNRRLVYIALLAAQAVVISLLERAIPFPFAFAPGAKLGLANIITCISLYTLSAKDTFMIICIRLVLSTLLGGTISTFMYSAAGAILSFLGMWLVQQLGPKRVSIIGVSVTGGILHNVGQLVLLVGLLVLGPLCFICQYYLSSAFFLGSRLGLQQITY